MTSESRPIGPVGSMEPVIVRRQWDTGAATFTAMLRDEAGEVWTFDCTHPHGAPEVAARCFRRLLRRWAEWAEAARAEVGPDAYSVIELRLGARHMSTQTADPP